MPITIRPLTPTESGTYDLGPDILPDLIQDTDQRPITITDAELCLEDRYREVSARYTNWGFVFEDQSTGDLLSVTSPASPPQTKEEGDTRPNHTTPRPSYRNSGPSLTRGESL